MRRKGIWTVLAAIVVVCFVFSAAGFVCAGEKETLKDFGIDKRHQQ